MLAPKNEQQFALENWVVKGHDPASFQEAFAVSCREGNSLHLREKM